MVAQELLTSGSFPACAETGAHRKLGMCWTGALSLNSILNYTNRSTYLRDVFTPSIILIQLQCSESADLLVIFRFILTIHLLETEYTK